MGPAKVILAPSVVEALLAVNSKDEVTRLRRRLSALEVVPLMGEIYDPLYDSVRPPHEVRVTFAGHYGIYYTYDEASREVHVEFLEDCRRDPLSKFRT